MTGIRVGFFALALLFVGMLVWAVKTGEMPLKITDIDRTRQPTMFWIVGAAYGLTAFACLYGAFTAV